MERATDDDRAVRNMHGHLRTMLVERRAVPGEDVLSKSIEAEVDRDRLSVTELVELPKRDPVRKKGCRSRRSCA